MLSFPTKRLKICPLSAKDKALYCQLYSDSLVMKYISPPLSIKQAKEYFDVQLKVMKSSQAQQLTWVISHKRNNQAFGLLALISKGATSAEIGLILSKNEMDKGYGKEILGAFILECRHKLSILTFSANIHPKNKKSIKLFTHFGFVFKEFIANKHGKAANYQLTFPNNKPAR